MSYGDEFLDIQAPLPRSQQQQSTYSPGPQAPIQRANTAAIANQNSRWAATTENNNTWNGIKNDPTQMKQLVQTAATQHIRDLQRQIAGYGKSNINGQAMETPDQLATWRKELTALQAGDHSSVANDEGYLRTIASPQINEVVALAPRVRQAQQVATDAQMAAAQGMHLAPYSQQRAKTDQMDATTQYLYPRMAQRMDAETGLMGAKTGQIQQSTNRDQAMLSTDLATEQEKLKQMQTGTPYIGPRNQAEIDAINNNRNQVSRKDHDVELGKRDKQITDLQRQNRILMERLARSAGGDSLVNEINQGSGATAATSTQQQNAPDGQPIKSTRIFNGRTYNQSQSGRWFDAITRKEVTQ